MTTVRHQPVPMRSRLIAAAAVVVLLLLRSSPALAQSDGPPARAHHALAYDPASQRVLLTGGSTPRDSGRAIVFFDDLWAYDGRRWTALRAAGERLSGVSLAYDTRRARLLAWGGFDGTTSRGDLRVLEPGGWRTLGSHDALRAAEPGFVYDAGRDRLVTFGGSAAPGHALGETWEHDGERWSRVDVAGPPARQAHVMVYDERRGRVVVFGGLGAAAGGQPSALLGDTWEYDGTRWTRFEGTGPSPRAVAGATYDARRGVILLYGGSGAGGFLSDTWAWDGSSWARLDVSGPGPRAMGAMAYDRARDRVVLFGGRRGWPNGDLADTWEWDGRAWSRPGR